MPRQHAWRNLSTARVARRHATSVPAALYLCLRTRRQRVCISRDVSLFCDHCMIAPTRSRVTTPPPAAGAPDEAVNALHADVNAAGATAALMALTPLPATDVLRARHAPPAAHAARANGIFGRRHPQYSAAERRASCRPRQPLSPSRRACGAVAAAAGRQQLHVHSQQPPALPMRCTPQQADARRRAARLLRAFQPACSTSARAIKISTASSCLYTTTAAVVVDDARIRSTQSADSGRPQMPPSGAR